MGPLAAIYHPGGADPNGYPVSIVDFISTWSEETGTITEAVCVMTDGGIRTLATGRTSRSSIAPSRKPSWRRRQPRTGSACSRARSRPSDSGADPGLPPGGAWHRRAMAG